MRNLVKGIQEGTLFWLQFRILYYFIASYGSIVQSFGQNSQNLTLLPLWIKFAVVGGGWLEVLGRTA